MVAVWHTAVQHARGHRRHLTRYVLVGFVGAAVNSGLLFFFVTVGHVHHVVAAALSAELSCLSNFVLHDYWTFRGTRPERPWPLRAASFNTVALTGIFVTVSVLAVLTTVGVYYMLANVFAMGAATISNYLLNSRFTWSLPWNRLPTQPLAQLTPASREVTIP
jgi:dolichol-phosphate mannosyltransferase